jgi:hypothetical protein
MTSTAVRIRPATVASASKVLLRISSASSVSPEFFGPRASWTWLAALSIAPAHKAKAEQSVPARRDFRPCSAWVRRGVMDMAGGTRLHSRGDTGDHDRHTAKSGSARSGWSLPLMLAAN